MKILVIAMICIFQVINYYLQMYLRILEICVLKYMNLFKKTEVKLELLTDTDIDRTRNYRINVSCNI